MTDIPIIDYEQDEKEYLLKDIAFEIYQIAKIKPLRNNIQFSKSCKNINESIKIMQNNKKRLIDEYIRRYQEEPDIENAKRIFARDKKTDGVEGREAGNANNNNSRP